MTVFPCLAKFFNSIITCRAVEESNPVVGSSKKMMLGFVINYTPIEVLFLSPPLIPLIIAFPTLVSAQEVSPSSKIRSWTILYFYALLTVSLRSHANLKHYLGVNVDKRASYCITYPMSLQYGSTDSIGCRLKRIPPLTVRLSDMSLPDKKLRSVVFPEPDGPRIAVKVESWISPCCLRKMILFSFLTLAEI